MNRLYSLLLKRWQALIFLAVGLLAAGPCRAQKVGLVLSGGGAKGLAHVGVLKQLEKNRIPIDYIIGTSMGAVVGALYAAGYSPDEIEQLALSPEFQSWTSGKPLESNVFNYLITEPSPAALHLGVALDSGFRVRTNFELVSDRNLNFALTRLLAPAGAQANYDFDRLLVPFRCLAAEVFTRRQVLQHAGSLSDAVRNSLAVPVAFRPIRNPDGRYLFDGGIYNTFPTDVMHREFAPDILIGVNVADVAYQHYPHQKDDQLLPGALLFLGADEADTLRLSRNTILIQPNLAGYGTGDFARVKGLIAAGDTAAQLQMGELRQRIARRVDTAAWQGRRRQFRTAAPALQFTDVRFTGLRDNQSAYALSFFRRRGATYTLDEVEKGYYRLAADEYFRNLYPRIRYRPAQQGYEFSGDAQRNNKATVDVGFGVASRPIDYFYLALEQRYLRRQLYSLRANVTLGNFYHGAQAALRINVPGHLPFYAEPALTYSQRNFESTSGLLGRDALSAQVRQTDRQVGLKVGVGPQYDSRVLLEVGAFATTDHTTNSADIKSAVVLDQTTLRGGTAAVQFARYTFNRRQYATAGLRVVATLRGVSGHSTYTPGTDSEVAASTGRKQWGQLRASAEHYFPLRGNRHSWGYLLELAASTQGSFATYRSSLALTPVFAPLPDARTLFLPAYRAASYGAAGLRYTRPIWGPVEWRTEAYVHVNVQPFVSNERQQAVRQAGLARPRLTASTGLVYQTPVGPLALHARFYDDPAARLGAYAHLGYLLFRGRVLE